LLRQEPLRKEEGGERKREVSLRDDVLEVFEHYEFHNKSTLILSCPNLPVNL
jgi:hypothetical protein